MNHRLTTDLAGVLDGAQLGALERSLSTMRRFSSSERAAVATVFARAFNQQMRVCTYLSVAGVLASAGTFLRNPPSIAAAREKEDLHPRQSDSLS